MLHHFLNSKPRWRCIFLSEDEAKGKAKQAEGKMKEAEGKMQEDWGKAKKKLS
jgi:hypothetical protein